MEKDIFGQIRSPYYLYTPPYTEASGGTRAIHYLCHALNLIGEEAYVTTDIVSKDLRTPTLNDETRARHASLGLEPITIYPEIVPDNPLAGKHVVRYLLNSPGVVNAQEITWGKSDLIFSFGREILPPGMDAHVLQIPLINTRIYNRDETNDQKRSGKLVFINRYLARGGKLQPITADAIEISYRVPSRTPEELAALYKQAEVLYTYEPSTACFEALLCGCPVVYIPNELLLPKRFEGYLGTDGCAWGTAPEALAHAKTTVHLAPKNYQEKQSSFWKQLDSFVEITQKKCQDERQTVLPSTGLQHLDKLERAYKKWLANREILHEDILALDQRSQSSTDTPTGFHIFLRLAPGNERLLADTLDSLGAQILTTWHLDIVTTLPAPEGLADVPCLGWHTLPSLNDSKSAIDYLVNIRNLQWVVELPIGARLDPLYLWRVEQESRSSPKMVACFTDDDCVAENNERHSPRFKPGANPSALLASDLAGPVCMAHDAWFKSGGATPGAGSPWFSQLLRTARQFGWGSIKHIPDVLITYPGRFPSEVEPCITALIEDFAIAGTPAEIIPVSGQSWNIRQQLGAPPAVSIAILSQGQLDLLSRCVESIIEKTSYPELEILLSVDASCTDPDLESWLTNLPNQFGRKICIVRPGLAGTHASRCNAAIENASNELVALVREEAVIIQSNWLRELVSTCMKEGVVAAAPRLIAPGNAIIQNAGSVLGLKGIVGSPYEGEAKLGENGILDCLQVARDVSILPEACMLVAKTAYQQAGGMDAIHLGNHHAEIDLCLKLRKNTKRLVFQPMATVVYGGRSELPAEGEIEHQSNLAIIESRARAVLLARWGKETTSDPYWNPNLSLASAVPTPEQEFHAQWQHLPSNTPRFLVRTLTNGQGIFRVTSPLRSLRKAGMASECIWAQEGPREPSAAEVLRLSPDTIVVQHYIHNRFLAALDSWHKLPNRPFIVYTIDDLLTNLAESNPFRKNLPANTRACLKYALDRCDRMVASTAYLADTYRNFINDIRIVPNRLEKNIWLPLQSRKRTGKKPRIGWAGGTTHHGDLILLKEVIEQTRAEADWVFFGMCPEEIRPIVSEYHPLGSFAEYPARLAALNLDIAVAPLATIPFNQGKSNLRLLEYGILGIPVICTDIDPYRGSPACCVANTASAWTKALRERIHDANAREREGNNLRQWVHDGYLLENHLEEWLLAHLPDRK